MYINQISVFVENESGRLSDVTDILAKNEIDIRALSLADTTDFGILRLIVNAPDKALEALRGTGFTVSKTKVIAARIDDSPGSLNKMLHCLREKGISVEYAYAFITRKQDDAYVILRIENLEAAAEVLTANGFELLQAAKVYDI